MAEAKTRPTDVAVEEFIAAVEPDRRRAEAETLDALFRKVTGFRAVMWGPSIIGYGRYSYTYPTGHSGEMCATGFSPRAKAISVYILPGYQDYGDLLVRLGRHTAGKSCLYVPVLERIDLAVLEQLVAVGLRDLAAFWPVFPE